MRTNRYLVLLAAAVFGTIPGACTPEYEGRKTFPAARITPRARWQATGAFDSPELAIDGDRRTAAVSGDSYTNATITIDLGKTCMFNTVIVDHGPEEYGYCRRVSVLTSVNGKDFKARLSAPGTRRVTVFSLVTPVLGRYVRLQATVPGARPWSIGEVYLQ